MRRGSARDRERDGVAAAEAQGGHPGARVALLHRVQERDEDARTRGTDGVPERDRARDLDVDMRLDVDIHILPGQVPSAT